MSTLGAANGSRCHTYTSLSTSQSQLGLFQPKCHLPKTTQLQDSEFEKQPKGALRFVLRGWINRKDKNLPKLVSKPISDGIVPFNMLSYRNIVAAAWRHRAISHCRFKMELITKILNTTHSSSSTSQSQ